MHSVLDPFQKMDLEWRFWGGGKMIKFEPHEKIRNVDAMEQLRRLAEKPLPSHARDIIERDEVLNLILRLPEDVLDQALLICKALRACAEHRHM